MVRAKKLDEVCRRIEAEIEAGQLRGSRIPGYREFSERLGVCRQTVQRALAELESDGVLERRHGSGTYALTPEQRKARAEVRELAVITCSNALSPAPRKAVEDILAGIASRAASAGVALRMLEWTDEAGRAAIESAREMRRMDGFIFVRFLRHDLVHALMALRRRPVVVVDEASQGVPATAIHDETFPGARAVVRHLIVRGHRRIGFVDVDDRALWNSCKFAGYQAALREGGLPEDGELVVAPRASVGAPQELLEREVDLALEALLGLAQPPTAIFAYDDRRALAVMAALRRRGLEPGPDIAVAGFGDTAARAGLSDELTSCRIPFRQMGERAVLAVLEPPFPAGQQGTLFVKDRLMPRASTLAWPRVAVAQGF